MPESQIDIGGAVVFWSLAEWTDRDRLHAGLEPLALGHFVPEPRAATACLKDALEEVLGGPRTLIRPLARRDGFVVVQEQRGEQGNAYCQELLARIVEGNGAPCPEFSPCDDRAAKVLESYRRQLGLLHATQVSTVLVKLVESLGGTRLRPSGAIYWLPGHRLDDWQKAADVFAQAGRGRPSAVYLLRHKMDADAVRAVRDAVVAEVQAEAMRIHDEIMTGELGGRALEHRQAQAAALRAKVLLYEELLDLGLQGLHQAVDRADQAAAAAVLLASAQPAEVMASAG
jgi:hypothetical protein